MNVELSISEIVYLKNILKSYNNEKSKEILNSFKQTLNCEYGKLTEHTESTNIIIKIKIGDRVRCFNNVCGVIISGESNTLTISDGNYTKDIDVSEVMEVNNSKFPNSKFQFSNSLNQNTFSLDEDFEKELNSELDKFDNSDHVNDEKYKCSNCGHTEFELKFSKKIYICKECRTFGYLE